MSWYGRIGKAFASAFGFGGSSPAPNNAPNGGDGVQAYGGYLVSDERNPELIGQRKWITYSNATNTAIIATGLRRTLDALAGTEWHAEPNPRGGKNAERAVDIVTEGLIDAQMPRPWQSVVRKTALYKYFGFSLSEWTTRVRADGRVVFAAIDHRPQYTIDRWDKPSEKEPWDAVSQLTRNGNRWVIPRGRLLYAVDDSLTDSPDGVGLMRHVVELVRRLGVLEGLEGLAYETDLRGTPVGSAPLAALRGEAGNDTAGGSDAAKIQTFIADRTRSMTELLKGMAKTPEKFTWMMLDSAPYSNADGSQVSTVRKWALDLIKGQSNGVAEVAGAIGRVQLEIARVLGIEHAMVGGNDSAGSFGMHKSKVDAHALMLRTILAEVASFATRDLARVLVALNGLDPDTCTPTLVAEPISTDTVTDTCQALQALAAAGAPIQPNSPIIPVIYDRMQLPPPDEVDPALMGVLGGAGKPSKRPGAKPPGRPGRPASSAATDAPPAAGA